MIKIDAASLTEGINYEEFLGEYYDGLGAGASTYHGGESDEFFGSEYYVSGPEVSFDYGDTTDQLVLLEGTEIAYDFIHYGSSFGHGISGEVDKITFGLADEGTGTEGSDPNGLVTGLDTGLVISGLSIAAEPGSGNDSSNPVYDLYDSARNAGVEDGAIENLYDIFSAEGQKVLGSAYADVFLGTDHADYIRGFDGDDVLGGGDGNDAIKGGLGDDTIIGGSGFDKLFGGEGADVFVFSGASDSPVGTPDKVMDFARGVDSFDLAGFGDLTEVAAFTGAAGEVILADDGGRFGSLQVDVSGNGEADFEVAIRFADAVDTDLFV